MHEFLTIKSRFGLLIIGLMLLGSLLVADRAMAQGTSGAFPDPISTREMERYCDLLTMSDPQRQGIGLYHDEYLDSLRVLRDGPIEDYLKEFGSRAGFMMSSRSDEEVLEKSIRKRQELMDRIASMDNRLFDRIQEVLTDDQIARMGRVRQARERTRYRAGLSRMMMFNSPGANVDLSEIVDNLKLSPSISKLVDPIVEQYERNLTGELRELYKDASTMQLDLQKKMKALGFGQGGMPRGREGREDYALAIQTVFTELNEGLREVSEDVSDLNKSTASQIARVMDEKTGRDLKQRYYNQTFPDLPTGKGQAGRRFRELERMQDLTDEQQEQVASIEQNFLRTFDGVLEQMVALREKSPNNPFEIRFNDANEDEPKDDFTRKMENLTEQRTALIDRSVNEINLVLGEELSRRLDARVAQGDVESREGEVTAVAVFMTAEGGAGAGQMMQSITLTSGSLEGISELETEETLDTYLPGPISQRDVDRYARHLGLSKEMQPILTSMHEDYRDGFGQLQETKIKDVRDQSRSLYSLDPETNEVSSPSRGDIERLYSLRRSALTSIKAIDDAFFNDVETILPDDDANAINMQRVRFARQRDIFSRGHDTGGFRMFGGGPGGGGGRAATFVMGGGNNSSEARVDLTDLVDELALTTQERAAIDPMLNEYESDITNQFQDAFETSMRFNEAMDAMRAESTTVSEGGSRRESRMGGGEMREIMQTDGAHQSEIRRSITNLNRTTLDKLSPLLSVESMNLLRDTYNRHSFPDIYNDPSSADSVLDAVYNLPNLAPHQQTQLDEIATEFRYGYEDLSQQMVESKLSEPLNQGGARRGRGGERGGRGGRGGGARRGGPGGFDFNAMQERQRAMEKLRFERKDLSDKTRNRLKAFLTEDQKAILGDLLEPKDDGAGRFMRIGG